MIKFQSLIFVLLLALAGCKYEDGPNISLRTKNHRAVNVWKLDKAFENGVDKTTDYKNAYVDYKIEIKDNDKYTLSYKAFGLLAYSESGNWSFSNDKSHINFTPTGTSTGASSWEILRLKEHDTHVIQNINGKDVELWMKD